MLCFSLSFNQIGDAGRESLVRSLARRPMSIDVGFDLENTVQKWKGLVRCAVTWILLSTMRKQFKRTLPELCCLCVIESLFQVDKVEDEGEEDEADDENGI